MERFRTIVAYKDYFSDFLSVQPVKVQDKIFKIIELIECTKIIPSNFIKHIKNTNGLYETRIALGNNIWRVFCFFEEESLVILLNGFQKKSQKTPAREIKRALKIMNEYFLEKGKNNEIKEYKKLERT